MNEVITKLNEIEEKANSIIEEAKNKKTQMEEQLRQEKDEIDVRFAEMENVRMEGLKAQLEKEAGEQISKMQAQNESAIAGLRENYEKNRENMADEIFRKIIE